MKYNPSELLRKMQFPLTIAAVSMPLALLLFSVFWPGWMPFVWLSAPPVPAALAL